MASLSTDEWQVVGQPQPRRKLIPRNYINSQKNKECSDEPQPPACAIHAGQISKSSAKNNMGRIEKIPPMNGVTLSIDNIAQVCNDWMSLRIWTKKTKSPFMVACLMMAMVVHISEAMSAFIYKLQQVGDEMDDDATLLDVMLTVWPELWYTLTSSQQNRISELLETQHIKIFPRKSPFNDAQHTAQHTAQSTVQHTVQNIDKIPDNKPMLKPVGKLRNKPTGSASKSRKKETVYPDGPQIFHEIGAQKMHIEAPLDVYDYDPADSSKSIDFPAFMKVTSSTHNPLILAKLLFKHMEVVKEKLIEQLKAVTSGVITITEENPMHIALYTAVACWPDIYHTNMTPDEQKCFRQAYAVTIATANARRNSKRLHEPRHKIMDGLDIEHQRMKHQMALSIVWEIHEYLMNMFQYYHDSLSETHPELTKFLDQFTGNHHGSYRDKACRSGKCQHRDKSCCCKAGKCPTLGCNDFATTGSCNHNGYCRKPYCPKKKCSVPGVSLRDSGALLDLLELLSLPRTQLRSLHRFITQNRFIMPVVNAFSGSYACGLSRGKVGIICFALFNARVNAKLPENLFKWSLIFQKKDARWWNNAWTAIQERMPLPFYTPDEIMQIYHELQLDNVDESSF